MLAGPEDVAPLRILKQLACRVRSLVAQSSQLQDWGVDENRAALVRAPPEGLSLDQFTAR